jgi:hypothetical protein
MDRHSVQALLLGVALVALARVAWAQRAGTIADIEGSAETGRGATWTAATIGTPVQVGDELRTGGPGRLRLVLEDASVLVIGGDSDVVVKQIFGVGRTPFRTVLGVQRGTVRALVSDDYRQHRAAYEIETVTAVASVRGTEFVIAYDPAAEVTETVGLTGQVEVHSQADRTGEGVFVTAQQLTRVARGRHPTPPQRLSEEAFRESLEKLRFIGARQPEQAVADAVLGEARDTVAHAHAASEQASKAPRGTWSVQVAAIRAASTAGGIARRLRKRGYEAYVVKMKGGGENVYRVRIGHYRSFEDAKRMMSRLRREAGVSGA